MSRRWSRMRVGLLLIGAFVALSALREVHTAVTLYRGSERPDEVSRHEARLQAVKHALPEHGLVGYVSDDPPEVADPSSSAARQAFKRYLLAQYALVPLVVVRGPAGELVVGDFRAPDAAGALTPSGFVMVKDFGAGVVLFRRLAR